MEFAKLHALGNDFLVVDVSGDEGYTRSLAALAKRLCHRHCGVGADGVLFYHATVGDTEAEYTTLIFNADGSRAEMSGNGVRCLAAYLCRTKDLSSPTLRIRTVSGIKALCLRESSAVSYTFDSFMGHPIVEPARIPVKVTGVAHPVVDYPLQVGSERIPATFLSMGNPHCCTFWDDLSEAAVERLGPLLETHEAFPNRANVEFIQILDRHRIRVRFWERGVGTTLASGTGSSAAAVASILRGAVQSPVTVETELGELQVRWEAGTELTLRGEAEFICIGQYLCDNS